MRHDKELNKFLTPVLQKQEAMEVKKFIKCMKSHVQALGINHTPPQQSDQLNVRSKKKETRKNSLENPTKVKELENTIVEMRK